MRRHRLVSASDLPVYVAEVVEGQRLGLAIAKLALNREAPLVHVDSLVPASLLPVNDAEVIDVCPLRLAVTDPRRLLTKLCP